RQKDIELEKLVKQKIDEKHIAWQNEQEKIIKEYKEKEQQLLQQISITKKEFEELKTKYETSQNSLSQLKSLMDEEKSSQQAQIDLLNTEIQQLQSKIISLENQKKPIDKDAVGNDEEIRKIENEQR